MFLFFSVVDIMYSDRKYLFWFMNVIIFSSLIVGIIGIFQYFGLNFFMRTSVSNERIYSTLGNANFLGGYLIMIIPVCLSMFLISKNTGLKIVYYWTLLILIFVLLCTQTLNAWIAIFIGMLFFVFYYLFYYRKHLKQVILITSVVVLLICSFTVLFYPEEAINKLQNLGKFNNLAEQGRWIMWRSCLEMIKERPFLGFGAGTFKLHFPFYESKILHGPTYESCSYIVSKDAHNDYLQIGAELGGGGMLIFIIFIGLSLMGGIKLLFRIKNDSKIVYIGIISAVISFSIHAFFNFPLKITPISSLFFLYAGILCSCFSVAEFFSKRNVMKVLVLTISLIVLFLSLFLFYFQLMANYTLGKGIIEIQKKNWDKALNHCHDALIFSRVIHVAGDFRIHYYLGEVFYYKKMYDYAVEEFKEEIRANPYFPDSKYNLGLIYQLQHMNEEAILEYKKALELSPNFKEAREKLDSFLQPSPSLK
ncbi:MAG: O-antigen ligase family protein [Candidatus Firestonebacteria bacterium]